MAAQNLDFQVESTELETSAIDLSVKVGGHALALTQIVALINTRQWSLHEFISLYNARPKAIHNLKPDGGIDSNYKFFINTVFREAFSGFRKSVAFTLLGVISFLVPDGIPQVLFEPKNKSMLPLSLNFCSDSLRYRVLHAVCINQTLLTSSVWTTLLSLYFDWLWSKRTPRVWSFEEYHCIALSKMNSCSLWKLMNVKNCLNKLLYYYILPFLSESRRDFSTRGGQSAKCTFNT